MHATSHNGAPAPGLAAPSRLPSPDADRLAPLAAAGAAHARIDRHPKTATPANEAGGDQGNTKADSTYSAARSAVEQSDKAFATLRARLALAGFELHIVNGDGGGTAYLVRRWCMSRTLPDVAAVRQFADHVGVQV